jgi:hypothetical protein
MSDLRKVMRSAWLVGFVGGIFLTVFFGIFLGCAHKASTIAPAQGERVWGDAPNSPRRIVFQNRYYAKPGKEDEVYQWRVHACDVLEQLGLPRGQVFRGSGGDQPDVIWQLELEPEAVERVLKRQAEVIKQFEPIMEHMGTLVRSFEGNRYAEIRHWGEGHK